MLPVMNTKMTEVGAMAENQSYILNRSKLIHVKLAVVMTLTVMVLAAATPSLLNLRQLSIAQEQNQHALSNQKALDTGTID